MQMKENEAATAEQFSAAAVVTDYTEWGQSVTGADAGWGAPSGW